MKKSNQPSHHEPHSDRLVNTETCMIILSPDTRISHHDYDFNRNNTGYGIFVKDYTYIHHLYYITNHLVLKFGEDFTSLSTIFQ